MEPEHDIAQKMEDLTIKPKARAMTPYITNTTMESTHRITQEMEDMTLEPKARAVTQYTATTSTNAHSVFSQLQPQPDSSSTAPMTTNTTGGYTYTQTSAGLSFSNPDASSSRSLSTPLFCFSANPTGGYVYTSSSGGLCFSNPNAGSSTSTSTSSSATTTTSTSTNQSETLDLTNHLLNCEDPIGLYKFSLYHSNLHHSHSHTHHHTASNRITKYRSTSSLRERYHQARRQCSATLASGTTVYEPRIERVPGVKTIYTTTAEEEAEEEKGRMTMAFFEHYIRRTKVRVVAEKTAAKAAAKAKAARQAQEESGSGTGACENDEFPTVQGRLDAWKNEVWMPRVKVSRTYVNGEGDVVEESWEKASPPISLGDASEGSHGMDDVEESVWEEDDEMVE